MNDLSVFRKGEALDYTKMGEIENLPNALGFDEFANKLKTHPNATSTNSNNNIYFNTPAGKVKIYIPRAYGHFYKNGKFGNDKENRQYLTGALADILAKPLFIIRGEQNKLYFYKPFKSKGGILDIVSVSVEKNGKIEYRTTYKDKFSQVLNFLDGYEVIYVAQQS